MQGYGVGAGHARPLPDAQRVDSGGFKLGLCLIQRRLVTIWTGHHPRAIGGANQLPAKALAQQLAQQSPRRRAAIAGYLPESFRIGPLAGEAMGPDDDDAGRGAVRCCLRAANKTPAFRAQSSA